MVPFQNGERSCGVSHASVLKTTCANGGELTKCNDNIKLVRIIKSYIDDKVL